MKITFWDVADTGEAAHVYNEQLTQIPHCHPVSPEEFEAGVRYRKNVDESYKIFIYSGSLDHCERVNNLWFSSLSKTTVTETLSSCNTDTALSQRPQRLFTRPSKL